MRVDEATIQKAAALLHEAAPDATVVLFGSHARGQGGPDSDLDFMVIVRQVSSRMDEMVRLRRVLSPLRVPVDVLVVSREQFDKWADTPGNVYHEAATAGRVMYEAA